MRYDKSGGLPVFIILLMICVFSVQIAPAQNSGPARNEAERPKKEKSPDENLLYEVRANFTVTDAEGKPVEGIKAEDLKIFENEKEQKVTYFAKKEPALNLGMVIDNSFSLRPQLPLLVALSKWFINNLKDKDEAFLIRFVGSEQINVQQDWTSDKTLLNQAADQMFIQGGATSITDALYLAAEKMLERAKRDNSKRYALIVVSDCEDRNSYYKLQDLFAKTSGTDLQIFVLALVKQLDNEIVMVRSSPQERAVKYAQRVAAKTGGMAYFPETDKQNRYTLSPSAEAIMAELRSPYVVGYVPTYQKTDDKKRKLRLEVADGPKGEKRSAVIKDGFFYR